MSTATADRNLLLGLLALKQDFVSRESLLDAVTAWLTRRHDPFAVVLRERGALAPEQITLLEAMVDGHLAPVRTVTHEGGTRGSDHSFVQSTVLPGGGTEVHAPPYVAPLWAGAPTTTGRYVRLREHARGGLGEVSVALDEELGREVALKEIQPQYADRADFRERFVREARITGKLEHPGIVPVYGLGNQADGRPYYAMRFVKGDSLQEVITRFHDADNAPDRAPGERELALRSLLTRFVAMCNAVGYSHSRGILHRDLKPANVMLGEYGETLVVDWGLAKAIDQAEPLPAGERALGWAEGQSSPTEMGQAVGTPAFMPPEQAKGEWDKVGPASDVWALGATLYCLLTGRPPYSGTNVLGQAAAGRVAPARQANRRVPAALEAVCHKAMDADPARRYAGATDVAREVERFLADEPVAAHREPPAQRLRRWAKRNRTLVTSAVVLLAASAIGLALGLWAVNAQRAEKVEALGRAEIESANARRAEGEAKDNLALSEKNLDLAKKAVDDCFAIADENHLLSQASLRSVRALLLQRTLAFYKAFKEQRPADRRIGAEIATYHSRVGQIQDVLGNSEEALSHYLAAEGEARRLLASSPDTRVYILRLAVVLDRLGLLRRAQADPVTAKKAMDEALTLARQAHRKGPGDHFTTNLLARVLHNQGSLVRSLGRRPEARALFTEAVELRRGLLRALPDDHGLMVGLGTTLTSLAGVEVEMSLPGRALAHLEEARDLHRAIFNAHPEHTSIQETLANTLSTLGVAQRESGKLEDALASHAEAVTCRRNLALLQPNLHFPRHDLALALNNLGNAQRALGQREVALASYVESRNLSREVVRARPKTPRYRKQLAVTLNNLGVLQRAMGDSKGALSSYAEAVVLRRAQLKEEPNAPDLQYELASTLANLANLQASRGLRAEAVPNFVEAAALYRALDAAQPETPRYRGRLIGTLGNLGIARVTLGQRKDALAAFTEARDVGRTLKGPAATHSAYALELGRAIFNRALLHRELAQPASAREDLVECLAVLARLLKAQPKHAAAARLVYLAHRQRAMALTEMGEPRLALADWDRALALAPPDERGAMRLARALGLGRAGEHDRAAAEAVALAQSRPFPGPSAVALGRTLALASAGVRDDARRPLPLRERQAETRARQAVVMLGRAAKAGHFKDEERRAELDNDDELKGLRGRADYRRFRAALGGARD